MNQKEDSNRIETNIAEETIREVISGVGLNPLDRYVRQCMTEALDDAIKLLPIKQRQVIESQVFGGKKGNRQFPYFQ